MTRILIVRTSAIGDIVFASPIAAALRATYPDAHIAWLAEPGLGALVADDPTVDEILVWPKAEWQRLWRERRWLTLAGAIRKFRTTMRAHRFDIAIDLQGLLKSGLVTWLSGAPRRIGLGSREGSHLLMTEVIPKGGIMERISSEYRFLAAQLGLPADPFVPTLHVNPEADSRARARLAELGIAPGTYAVLAPFTTRPQKHWFEDAWQALAPLIPQRLGLTPVMLGGPADVAAAARIASPGAGIVNLAGSTSLAETVALIAHAGLVIGVDTGLTHMGIGLARPTVALFGSTRPYLDTGRPNARVIWLGLACSPCRRHPTCHGAFTCLRDISPERVLTEARTVLETPAP
ncbi:MAG: lipopolysaccharide heptosyltransferase II [Zoogloeaceae bacterium]|nr:lipopolysaccharide heptosyltransferase II [Zoogloeaceae bacterium]